MGEEQLLVGRRAHLPPRFGIQFNTNILLQSRQTRQTTSQTIPGRARTPHGQRPVERYPVAIISEIERQHQELSARSVLYVPTDRCR